MLLENKKALVTGAGRGIGKAISEKFMSEGAEVWGLDINEPADLPGRIEQAKGKLHWVCADLGKLNELEEIINKVQKEAGGFDILMNNAGITKDNLAFRMSVADFQKVLDINLSATFFIARTVGRDMAAKRRGSIISMASVSGIHGNAGQANYAASKAGVIGITKTLALEIAKRGVRVNAIAPGFVCTDMTAVLSDDVKKAMADHIPMKRLGQPEDVANLALFLASDLSSYITGQVIPVDGGMFT